MNIPDHILERLASGVYTPSRKQATAMALELLNRRRAQNDEEKIGVNGKSLEETLEDSDDGRGHRYYSDW
jgi:hypothetical protein